jgi:hypothetical protein
VAGCASVFSTFLDYLARAALQPADPQPYASQSQARTTAPPGLVSSAKHDRGVKVLLLVCGEKSVVGIGHSVLRCGVLSRGLGVTCQERDIPLGRDTKCCEEFVCSGAFVAQTPIEICAPQKVL